MFTHDMRYALRMFARQPGTTATIVLTLALGIGANTAVFSVVHAVLLRPLPYTEPDRLVMVWEKRPAEGVFNNSVSPADFLDWRTMNKSFTGMVAFSQTAVDLTGVGEPLQLPIGAVSARFFDLLGVRALHGRTFADDEEVLGRHRVVVLGHALWQQRFGASPAVVGQTIQLNDIPFQVIGVLPREFEFPGERLDMWVPLVLQTPDAAPPRASHYLSVYARLAAGATPDSARADMDRVGAALSETYPVENRYHSAHVVALRDEVVGPARGGLFVITAAVAFLLLIACTNVANLLLARSAGRRREMAIRAAVGAGRGRLLRQTLTESMVLAALGGIAGLLLASGAVQLLVAETPPALRGVGLDRARLDLPVLLFTFAVCGLTALIAGVIPAWHASRDEPGDPMREGGRSPLTLRRGLRFTLIATEVALTALLLIGAGLFVRSFVRVLSQPAGFEMENRLAVTLSLPRLRYPNVEAIGRTRRLLEERFNSIPGVIAAGATIGVPLSGFNARQGITVEGLERRDGDAPVRAHPRTITPKYFEAMDIGVREGRGIIAADDANARPVVVVNETMAKRYWPGQSAVGKRMRFNGGQEPWREVVGVIGDVRHWGLDVPAEPEVYLPYEQQSRNSMTFVLHTAGDPASVVSAVAAVVKTIDPNLPLGTPRTLEAIAARSLAARRWSVLLLGMFAVLGLVLAAAGIYGVMAHLVSMRTGEIGIRMTLGAHPTGVLRQVLGEALLHASIGLAAGLALAFALMRGVNAMLFEITAADPLTFAGAALMVVCVALLAGAVPAIRAMRVDPVQALRAE